MWMIYSLKSCLYMTSAWLKHKAPIREADYMGMPTVLFMKTVRIKAHNNITLSTCVSLIFLEHHSTAVVMDMWSRCAQQKKDI